MRFTCTFSFILHHAFHNPLGRFPSRWVEASSFVMVFNFENLCCFARLRTDLSPRTSSFLAFKCYNNASKLFDSPVKTEAEQRWLNGIAFILNGRVCARRLKRGCHFEAEAKYFCLLSVRIVDGISIQRHLQKIESLRVKKKERNTFSFVFVVTSIDIPPPGINENDLA